jgi:hypothetical protein
LSKESAKRSAALRREPAIFLFLFRPGHSLFLRINPPVIGKKTPCYRNKKRRADPSFRRSPSADGRARAGGNRVEFQKVVIFRLTEVAVLLF